MENYYYLESYRVRLHVKEPITKRINDAEQAVAMAREIYKDLEPDREHFVVFYLDKALKVKKFKVMFSGTIDETPVYIREIAKDAILIGATAIVCVHNHPSGKLEPSPEDIRVTERIKEAMKLFEMRLMDHIILTDDNYFSMSTEGIIHG